MNAFWGSIISNVLKIFLGLMGQLTPVIKDELNAFLIALYKKALATPNPWDDFAVGLLLDMMGIPRPPAE
jgi:hypothetical protein